MDRVYRSFLSSVKFFAKGWGPVDTYRRLLDMRHLIFDRRQCARLLEDHAHPIRCEKVREISEGAVYNGEFLSPLATLFPGFLPKEAEVARFELLLPRVWNRSHKPVFIHLAGTGDHYFWRRRYTMALPLLKEGGVGSLLLENPFYGSRKPKAQVRSQLLHVSDLLVMGLALIMECHLLLPWLEGEGLGPVGLTGISMGGHNASLAAALCPRPIAVVPCLSWATASCVFTKGVLSSAVCWEVLERQLMASGSRGGLGDLFYGVVCEHTKVARLENKPANVEQRAAIGDLSDQVLDLPVAPVDSATDQRGAPPTSSPQWGAPLTSSPQRGAPLTSSPQRGAPLTSSPQRGAPPTSSPQWGAPPTSSPQWGAPPTSSPQRGAPPTSSPVSRQSKQYMPSAHTLLTMDAILDYSTHLRYFPVPLAPNLATFLVARDDLYIPRDNVTDVRSIWPGCDVQYIDGGHVMSCLAKQPHFRNALYNILDKMLTSPTTYAA